MYQTFRMGVRQPKNGVITIASFIQGDQIFYGVSYCSPSEKQYSRITGTTLAKERMDANMAAGVSIPLTELKHSAVVVDIILDIVNSDNYPRWASELLFKNLMYPVGLKRFKKNGVPTFDFSITVDSEETKQQLLLALHYIHNLSEIDTSYIAVNALVHLPLDPSRIIVK